VAGSMLASGSRPAGPPPVPLGADDRTRADGEPGRTVGHCADERDRSETHRQGGAVSMTQTIRLGNKLIKLIKFLTGKETHKTHKTHDVSTGNKLIKLIKRGGVDETHEFLKASPRPDKGFACFTERLNTQYEFYEFPPALTCEEKQYRTGVKTCTRRDWKQTHRTHKLIRLQGAV